LDKYQDEIGCDPSSGEMVLNGEAVPGSRYNDLIRECYIHNSRHNVTGLESFLEKLHSLDPTHFGSNKEQTHRFLSNHGIIDKLSALQGRSFLDAGDAAITANTISSSTISNLIPLKSSSSNSTLSNKKPQPPPGKSAEALKLYQ